MKEITPFLWFDARAEEAAEFYVSVVPRSRIVDVVRYGSAGPGEPGSVMTVAFELNGRPFVALNGGPEFSFTEAVSFAIECETQAEVDELWDRLVEGGGEHGPCGWLKDRFGLSWQVVPSELQQLLRDPDPDRSQRVMAAMLKMGKIEVEPLRRAYEGTGAHASA